MNYTLLEYIVVVVMLRLAHVTEVKISQYCIVFCRCIIICFLIVLILILILKLLSKSKLTFKVSKEKHPKQKIFSNPTIKQQDFESFLHVLKLLQRDSVRPQPDESKKGKPISIANSCRLKVFFKCIFPIFDAFVPL